jgi:beta-xylosidase/AraC-like DNA-binding protein
MIHSRRTKKTSTRAWICHPVKPLVHSGSDLEIIFVLEGDLTVSSGTELRRIRPPDILLLNPLGTLLSENSSKPNTKMTRISPLKDSYLLCVRIDPLFLASVFGDAVPAFNCTPDLRDKDFSALRNILAEIASLDTSITASSSGNGLLFYSRLYRLLDELTAHFAASGDSIAGSEGEDGKRRQVIHEYIKKNFRFPVSLNELADFLYLSPQYLSRYFKKLYGVNFHTYITRFRLESALKELATTDNPVTAIAYDNGFPNLTAFTKEMKEEIGQTPTAYRKAHREQAENHTFDEDGAIVDPAMIRDKLAALMGENNIPSNNRKILSVDSRTEKSFAKPWQEVINLGFARDIEKAEFMAQIRLIQDKVPFRYARFYNIFERSMLSSKESSEYRFAKTDKIIDQIYQVRLLPFIELCPKYTNLFKAADTFVFDMDNKEIESETFPFEEYKNMVVHFIKHAINRYGIQEVNRWRFEYYAPADRPEDYQDEAIEKYVHQFVCIKDTIKTLLPAVLVGGPGLAKISDMEFIRKILRRLVAENSIPDFLSCYTFSSVQEIADADTENTRIFLWVKDDAQKRIAWIKGNIENLYRDMGNEKAKEFSVKPFYVTEWNIDFSCRNFIHDSLLKASFILQNSIDAIDQVDVLCYWLASDISAEYTDSDAPLFGGPGLISRHGIQKPAFFAYQFLSKLGNRLLSKGNGYIVTAKSEHEFVAILFNYKYINSHYRFADQIRNISGNLSTYLEDLENCVFSLEISNITAGRYRLRQHILNSRHGSVYDAWLGLSAIESLQSDETAWLERTCVPGLSIQFLEEKESLTVECNLEPNEVRLLEISLVQE